MANKKNPLKEMQRKSQIMLATAQLLTNNSYHGMTLDKVAAQIGFSKGVITYYFKSKQDLMLQTIRFFASQFANTMNALIDSEHSVAARIEDLVALSLSSRPQLELMTRYRVEVLAQAKNNQALMKLSRQINREFLDSMTRLAEEGIASNEIRPLGARWVARFLAAITDGLCIQVILDPEFDVEGARGAALDTVRAALLTSPALRPESG